MKSSADMEGFENYGLQGDLLDLPSWSTLILVMLQML